MGTSPLIVLPANDVNVFPKFKSTCTMLLILMYFHIDLNFVKGIKINCREHVKNGKLNNNYSGGGYRGAEASIGLKAIFPFTLRC